MQKQLSIYMYFGVGTLERWNMVLLEFQKMLGYEIPRDFATLYLGYVKNIVSKED